MVEGIAGQDIRSSKEIQRSTMEGVRFCKARDPFYGSSFGFPSY